MSILSKESAEKIKDVKNMFVIISNGVVSEIGNMDLVGFVEPDFDNSCLYVDYGSMWIRGDAFIPIDITEFEDWEDFFVSLDEKRGCLFLDARNINSKNTDWNNLISEAILNWDEM